jgi:hypothetical protein
VKTEQGTLLDTLTTGGNDGLGGHFAFSYNYVPALNGLAAHIVYGIDEILGGLQLKIDSLGLPPEETAKLKQEAYESCREMADAHLEKSRDHFINGIRHKIASAIAEHFDESVTVAKIAFDGKPFGQWGVSVKSHKPLEGLLKWRGKETKRRLNARSQGGSKAEYDWSQLSEYYREQLPRWQDAKDNIFTPNSRNSRWRKWVKSEYSDFDDDLIEWLSDNPELPERILSEGLTKGMTSSPSDIAIMHSARLCGAAGYPRTTRRLHQIRSRQEHGETHL